LQLDDNLKNLLRELGHAINDTVSESERITGAIAGVRAHGYDIVLKLDATIGLAKRDGSSGETDRTNDAGQAVSLSRCEFRWIRNRSSRIRIVTGGAADHDAAGRALFEIAENCDG